MNDKVLNLKIEADELERLCAQLLSRSRDLVKTQDSLVTLETFIKRFGAGSDGSEAYRAIEAVMARYTEQAREQLLQQKMQELLQALKSRDTSAIALIHTPLSRNGFHLIAQQAMTQLTQAELDEIRQWAVVWTTEARKRADQYSPYPDAPDFRAVGIDRNVYLAMQDMSRYLASMV